MAKLLSATALAALLATTCMPTAAAPPSLDCRIEPKPPLIAGGPVEIRFVLTNRGGRPLWFLRWNTPFERWKGSILTVTGPDGAKIPYAGPMVKRGDPTREDYVEVPPGGTVEAVTDLANVYDLSRPGTCRVEVSEGLLDLISEGATLPRPRDRHEPADLRCEPITLEVSAPPA